MEQEVGRQAQEVLAVLHLDDAREVLQSSALTSLARLQVDQDMQHSNPMERSHR